MIRPLSAADVSGLCEVHFEHLRDSIPCRLGRGFLEAYYRALLPDPRFHCDGFFADDTLVGFLAYTSDGSEVYRRAARKSAAELTAALLRGILRRPSRLVDATKIAVAMRSARDEPHGEIAAELVSLAVRAPIAVRLNYTRVKEGEGTVGRALIEHGLDTLRAGGVRRVKALTRPVEEDPSINRLYERLGFECPGTVRRFGRRANVHVRDLEMGEHRDCDRPHKDGLEDPGR